jgi:hypothetical protein
MKSTPYTHARDMDELTNTQLDRRESALGDLDEGGNPLVSFAKSRNGGEYDPSKFMSVKEVWVNQQMDQRSSEFTDYKPLRYRTRILLPRTRHTAHT